MQNHHGFSPSTLDHSPRPTEREIRIKTPAMCHDGRTKGEQPNG